MVAYEENGGQGVEPCKSVFRIDTIDRFKRECDTDVDGCCAELVEASELRSFVANRVEQEVGGEGRCRTDDCFPTGRHSARESSCDAAKNQHPVGCESSDMWLDRRTVVFASIRLASAA